MEVPNEEEFTKQRRKATRLLTYFHDPAGSSITQMKGLRVEQSKGGQNNE